jgi:arylformamidase
MNKGRIIELSHRMVPGRGPFELRAQTWDVTDVLPEVVHRPEIWYIIGEVEFSTHAYTHIEVPYHHWQAGADVADYPLKNLIGEAVVLDFSHKEDGDVITLEEVQAHAGRLQNVDMIFIRTDLDRHFFTERWNEQPSLTEEAMAWLISLGVTVIGTDSAGFEVPGTDYQPNHLAMFKNNVAMVESCTNLASIGDEQVTVFILPLPIEGIDACPVRIIAFRQGDLCSEQRSRDK